MFYSKGLDLAAKSLAAGSKGIIKPTPRGSIDLSARKRLSRKSPGPELRKPLRSIPPPSNVVVCNYLYLFFTKHFINI